MPNHRSKFVGVESRTELWMSGDRAEPQNVDKRQTCTQAVKSCHFKSKFIKFDARTLHADLNKPNIHSPVPKLSKFALFNCVNLNDVELYAICVRRAGWLAGCQRCHILTDRKPPQKKTFRIKWEFMLAMLMRYGDNKKANFACTKQHTIRIKLMCPTSRWALWGCSCSRRISQFLCQAADPLNVAVPSGIAVLSCRKSLKIAEAQTPSSESVNAAIKTSAMSIRQLISCPQHPLFRFCVVFLVRGLVTKTFCRKCLFLCSSPAFPACLSLEVKSFVRKTLVNVYKL